MERKLSVTVCLLFLLEKALSSSFAEQKLYVVYLGEKGSKLDEELVQDHHRILVTGHFSPRLQPPQLVYHYKNTFSGFAARMSKEQAQVIADMDEVLRVFPSKTLKLHTTRSWDYLQQLPASQLQHANKSYADVIIGVVDTGIWPEAESFKDDGYPSPPSRWKGACVNSRTAAASAVNCTNKIIGARAYDVTREPRYFTARDFDGHGSHVASTAAGNEVHGANLFGLANGTARGGLPTARLAVYKACSEDRCEDADILKAMDDAVADGVDILSLSLGSDNPRGYGEDAIAIGGFHASANNVPVVCSCGNSGLLGSSTVVNDAPWLFTVGANTIDRRISSNILLGNDMVLQGTAFNLHRTNASILVLGSEVAYNNSMFPGRNCSPGALVQRLVKGRIVVCDLTGESISQLVEVGSYLYDAGAAGVILIYDELFYEAHQFYLPTTIIKRSTGDEITAYITSSAFPTATILPSHALTTLPAPVMAAFSSKGPSQNTPDIIKPDITAPGVNILAAWTGGRPIPFTLRAGQSVFADYVFLSGTSMSCPHVTGALAYVKSVHPNWSPAALKSALMTTATTQDSFREGITDFDGQPANPFVSGSGQINPSKAIDPGLVYDITTADYISYLCALNRTDAKLVTGNPSVCNRDQTRQEYLNYPSFSFPKVKVGVKQTATRELTSVSSSGLYSAIVSPPPGVSISVQPEELTFSLVGDKKTYNLTVVSDGSARGWQFGFIVWTDGTHSVRSPIAMKC